MSKVKLMAIQLQEFGLNPSDWIVSKIRTRQQPPSLDVQWKHKEDSDYALRGQLKKLNCQKNFYIENLEFRLT